VGSQAHWVPLHVGPMLSAHGSTVPPTGVVPCPPTVVADSPQKRGGRRRIAPLNARAIEHLLNASVIILSFLACGRAAACPIHATSGRPRNPDQHTVCSRLRSFITPFVCVPRVHRSPLNLLPSRLPGLRRSACRLPPLSLLPLPPLLLISPKRFFPQADLSVGVVTVLVKGP
jgi:hypothetical protein